MDRTLEDNMVDSLFFRATLTGRRGGHTPFVQAGVETSDTGAEAVKPDTGSSWEGHSGVCVYWCLELKRGVLWGCPPTSRMIRPLRHTYVVVVRKTELLCGGYKWVSRFEAPCICTRWTSERLVEQVSRFHGTAH